MMNVGQHQSTTQRQRQALGARQFQGLGLLMKSLPELRVELSKAISENPVLEDIDHPLETPLSAVEQSNREQESDAMPDYPDDGYEPVVNRDEDAAERRQAFFDNQVKRETLQEHLLAQLPLSDIPRTEWPLVAVLVGDLDDNGFYKGSVADACMSFGKTEPQVRATLKAITELDPPGCGATTARECLLAQIDALEDSPYQDEVRRMIEHHLPAIAEGRFDQVAKTLGLTREQYAAALREMRTLNAKPGAAFPSERDRVEYVNPEVHAVRADGRWHALTDKRSLPEIRVAKKYLELLKDPNQSEETKAYVRDRIAAASELREAVARRQETVESIAQEIFERQQGFFTGGFAALRPLTETEVAKAVGVDVSTVSRTVKGKYASTPKGTVELRRFFVSSVKTDSGETISQQAALDKLEEIVKAEDKRVPLSDAKLVDAMAAAGFPIARRTIAKYRDRLGIPGALERTEK